jgi:hypothetical protein
MKKLIASICTLTLLVACNDSSISSSNKSREVGSAIAAGGQTESELKQSLKDLEKEELTRQKEIQSQMTSLKFDRLNHDYGTIKPETDNTTSFLVTNTGDKPLIIESVDASCGCTTPKKPEQPILPGKSDKIEVVFHPKPGQLNEIKKTVTVTANTDPKITVLNIRAFVKE